MWIAGILIVVMLALMLREYGNAIHTSHYCLVCHKEFNGTHSYELSEDCTYSHDYSEYDSYQNQVSTGEGCDSEKPR